MSGAIFVVAALITGAVVGCFLAMTIATAAISHSQEWMARKVRYWQAEAARARRDARRARGGRLLPPRKR